MKYKIQSNRSIPEKKKITRTKKSEIKHKVIGTKDAENSKELGTIPTKFQFDDDYDNWFPWETY